MWMYMGMKFKARYCFTNKAINYESLPNLNLQPLNCLVALCMTE